ncbi:hypothetical protein [Nannocystis bainbridge]|uniref:Lipoprotein n=1 Tax=Nannocystis bainbridge TaxID=2995303 RepID=A0ABT5DQL3_9BACT|nr:hypothetical protein [Nannocystis bainbridge]MDC0715947.1 hypothetical protein [Nannocystis bainbridge]
MSRSRPCTLLCLWLVACTAPEPAPQPTAKPEAQPAAKPAPEVVPPTLPARVEAPAPTPEPAPPVAVADGNTGVPACDAYADRYRTCIADKLPADSREAHARVLKAQMAAWLAAGADAKLTPALDGECTAAAVAARASTRVFGCVWRDGDAPEPELPRAGKVQPEVVHTSRRIDPDLIDY